jgi:chromosome segregation ATPase
MNGLTVGEAELKRLSDQIAAITAEVFPCRRSDYSAEDNLAALQRVFRELRGEGHRLKAELRRTADELERTRSELHRPRGDGLSVGEHVALVQRAQGIAKTDHAELVRAQRDLAAVQRELAEARTEACTEIQRLHTELQRLQRRARRRAPAISGRRGLGRRRGSGR